MLEVQDLTGFTSPKILTLKEAQQRVSFLKSKGKTIGLCHGGFDLLHSGHIKHFESAKKLCDVLVVSVTSDRFVAGRKGSGRPVFTDRLRAYSIAALECVDTVVITDVEKAVPLLELLRPSYYLKGPDFIQKATPGIAAERETITRVGGEMKYTRDQKLSTTEIIKYIQESLDQKELLLILDRDGTLIEHEDFFGKSNNWRKELRLRRSVVDYLAYLQTKYTTVKIVVSNQAGVARRLYDCATVEAIHQEIERELATEGIKMDSWQYCPDVDAAYAAGHPELGLDLSFIKERTKRKPNTDMVLEALRELKKEITDFSTILVLGDREEDKRLAENLRGGFIDVKEKMLDDLKTKFA